jgi:UDP-glucose 4-epimerase
LITIEPIKNMSEKKILIFGAAGFMGTYLVDALSKSGYKVTASDISEAGRRFCEERGISYILADITKKEDFSKLPAEPFDAVIHLAATQPANVSEKNYDPASYIQVNVIGTLNILEFCRRNGAGKIIYASSHRNTQAMWVENRPISEKDGRALKFDGQYAMFSISESAAQDCVSHFDAQHGLKSIIFRLPPVYGFGPHTEIFMDGKPIKTGFQIFIENARACKPLELWGDSSKGRDIVYIKDVIDAFVKAIESGTARGLYNITSGYKLTLREEAETIAKVFWGSSDKPVIIERPEKPNNIDSFVYDISKAEKELGWKPKYSFEDMLHDYIREGEQNTFGYLVEKRRAQLKDE